MTGTNLALEEYGDAGGGGGRGGTWVHGCTMAMQLTQCSL